MIKEELLDIKIEDLKKQHGVEHWIMTEKSLKKNGIKLTFENENETISIGAKKMEATKIIYDYLICEEKKEQTFYENFKHFFISYLDTIGKTLEDLTLKEIESIANSVIEQIMGED